MENIMEKLTEDTINEIKDTEVKKIVIENEVTPEQQAIMESIKRLISMKIFKIIKEFPQKVERLNNFISEFFQTFKEKRMHILFF